MLGESCFQGLLQTKHFVIQTWKMWSKYETDTKTFEIDQKQRTIWYTNVSLSVSWSTKKIIVLSIAIYQSIKYLTIYILTTNTTSVWSDDKTLNPKFFFTESRGRSRTEEERLNETERRIRDCERKQIAHLRRTWMSERIERRRRRRRILGGWKRENPQKDMSLKFWIPTTHCWET